MFNFFQNLRKTKQKEKSKSEKLQVSSIPVGSFVVLDLNPDICSQLQKNGSQRYDGEVLTKHQVKGLVKAVYVEGNTNSSYLELLGLSINGNVGSRREYVVLECEIQKLLIVAT